MELLFLGALLGGLISWLIAHWYYKKSNADQAELYSKLTSDIREAILEDQRKTLSVQELNDLLEQITIDPKDASPLPYKCCPKCGSEKLQRQSSMDDTKDRLYYFIVCEDCGWSEWTE